MGFAIANIGIVLKGLSDWLRWTRPIVAPPLRILRVRGGVMDLWSEFP
jgi:hypothetical protein